MIEGSELSTSVLMIAYHFPPCAEVSGSLRTISMANYLAVSGYKPIILTPTQHAYPYVSINKPALNENCVVVNSFSLDAARHMGISGRYPKHLARPDRWASWWLSAVPQGLRLIRRHKPVIIWSTYPIATSHMIANTLHRLSKIPWIADFRDPMVLDEYQIPKAIMTSRERLEKAVIKNADACVFVTHNMIKLYAERYKRIRHGDFELIQNGFDEESFSALEEMSCEFKYTQTTVEAPSKTIVLVHSGVLYPNGRNPYGLFKAISNLLKSGSISMDTFKVVLRASGSTDTYAKMISEYGLSQIIELAPMIERIDALRELYSADGLLLFQGREFNAQVPAKIYEYFRVGKPIFALVDKGGETARIIRDEHAGIIVDMDNPCEIEAGLMDFIEIIRSGVYGRVLGDSLEKYSRNVGAKKLVQLIKRISDGT